MAIKDLGIELMPSFITALAIGLLIGLERERHPIALAGLRTFALVGLIGAMTATMATILAAPSVISIGLIVISALAITANVRYGKVLYKDDPGTTTVAAIILCYLFGVMVSLGYTQLTVMLAIIATALLYFKSELGGAARRLERRDILSIMQFAVVTFIILPLLPTGEYGPYQALNPRHIWLMVVLISGVSLVGYVALRIIGRQYGAIVLGIFGGLISSTATTLAYARYAKSDETLNSLAIEVIVTSNLILPIRLAGFALIMAPEALPTLIPILAFGLITGIVMYVIQRQSLQSKKEITIPDIKNPVELKTALGFAIIYTIILILSAWVNHHAGNNGIYVTAFLFGLSDVDAIMLSNLRLFGIGTLSTNVLVTSTVIALFANSIFKIGIIYFTGNSIILRQCYPVLLSIAFGSGVGLIAFL